MGLIYYMRIDEGGLLVVGMLLVAQGIVGSMGLTYGKRRRGVISSPIWG